jgi:hypothetical protein
MIQGGHRGVPQVESFGTASVFVVAGARNYLWANRSLEFGFEVIA